MRALLSILGLSFLFAGVVLAAPAPAPTDFVTQAIKADNSEIMLGNYAAEHGTSASVKKFGQTLAADHTKAKDQMTQLAQKIDVTPPTGATPEAQAEMEKLKSLQGRDFDKEFAAYMVNDHRKDIAKFQAEAKAKNGSTSSLAAKQIAPMRKHLRMAEQIEKG